MVLVESPVAGILAVFSYEKFGAEVLLPLDFIGITELMTGLIKLVAL